MSKVELTLAEYTALIERANRLETIIKCIRTYAARDIVRMIDNGMRTQ